MNWPAYFQPSLSARLQSSQSSLLQTETSPEALPIYLLDAFYLSHTDCVPELFVIVGLANGGLRVIRAHEIQTLPDILQRQLRAALASRRGSLCTIRASQLLILTFDSIEQRQMSGLNDAVLLFGHAHAQMDCMLKTWDVTPLNQPGALTVGRLDFLNGYVLGFPYVWRNPESPSDFVSHLFVPAGSLAEAQRGHSLALVYPWFEADAVSSQPHIDNTIFTMRLIYDVLLTLQRDLMRDHSLHPFVNTVIPVPSRPSLEYALTAEGYEIDGDDAVRVGKIDSHTQLDLLDQLRRWAANWNAPRIKLPPQAGPQDYRDLIEQALEIAANDSDKAMMQVMAQRLQTGPIASVSSQSSSSLSVASSPLPEHSDGPMYEATPRFDEVLAQPVPTAQPILPVRPPKDNDWSKDFGSPVKPPKAKSPQTKEWANDFDTASDVSEASGTTADTINDDFDT